MMVPRRRARRSPMPVTSCSYKPGSPLNACLFLYPYTVASHVHEASKADKPGDCKADFALS